MKYKVGDRIIPISSLELPSSEIMKYIYTIEIVSLSSYTTLLIYSTSIREYPISIVDNHSIKLSETLELLLT